MILRTFLTLFCIFGVYQKSSLISSSQTSSPYISVMGPLLMADGIGRVAPEIAATLEGEIEFELLASDLMGIPIPAKWFTRTGISSSVLSRVGNSKKPLGKFILFTGHLWGSKKPKKQLAIYKKFESKRNLDRIRVAYSMFESSKIPPEWVNNLNNYFDVTVVPDDYLVNVYKESGVKIPIFVLPMPLKLNDLYELPLKKERNYPMVFGSLSAGVDRKNLLMTVQAFVKAFGVNNPDVELRIHCRYDLENVLEPIKKEIESLNATNIKIHDSHVPSKKYLNLVQDIDIYVNLSRGEGFSIQPREAMALGIPVILSDNTVHHTICNSKLVRAVPSNIEVPAPYPLDKKVYGVQFNCTVEDAALAFLDVYNNYDKYLENGKEAREWTRQYTHEKIRTLYKNFLMPKNIVLGDEDKFTDEHLMTSSKSLYEKFLKIKNSN